MFSEDKGIDNIHQLFKEVKKFVEMQTEYTKLEIVEKLTLLLSTLIMTAIMILLGIVALFYLSLTVAYLLAPVVGGITVSFAIITGFIILLILILMIFRKKLISTPLVNFLVNLLFNDSDK